MIVRRLLGLDTGRQSASGSVFKVVTETWAPTHKHNKGGLYRFLSAGILEADRSSVVIYDDAEGAIWVRPTGEFHDGRFQPL